MNQEFCFIIEYAKHYYNLNNLNIDFVWDMELGEGIKIV